MAIKKIEKNLAQTARNGDSSQNNENTGVINGSYRNQLYHMNLSWRLNKNSPLMHVGFFEFDINKCLQEGLIREENEKFRFRIIHKSSGDIVLQLNENSPAFKMGHLNR